MVNNKIDPRLKLQMKNLSDESPSLSVIVFFSPCLEDELQTALETNYQIKVSRDDAESSIEDITNELIDNFNKRIGEKSAATRVVDFIDANLDDVNGTISKIKNQIPHGELLTNKLIRNCAKAGKTMSDLMLLAHTQYESLSRRECIRKFITEKREKIKQIVYDGQSTIIKENPNLSWIIVSASPSLIAKLEKLDFVKSISLHENLKAMPSLKVSNSNQTKMTIDTSKAAGYDGTGVNIGIIEAVEFTNVAGTKYKEGIDSSYRHLEDADITWKSYSPSASATKVGASDHANQVASIIVGQKRETWFVEYEGVAPGATVFGTSCSDDISLYDAIDYLIGKNVSVINMSFEFTTSNAYSSIDEAIDEIAALHNITFIVSAGNLRSDYNPTAKITSPAHAYNAISVGNLDTTGSAPYAVNTSSNYNQSGCTWETNKPDICASGTDITFSKSSVATESNTGTSFSAPYVTGVVAQMMEADSSLKTNYTRVKALLLVSANNSTSIVSTTNSNSLISDSSVLRNKSGGGIIDAGIAVDMARRHCGTGGVYDLSQSQTIGQLFKVSSASALTAEAGQTIRMVLCFNKPESGVLNSQYGNNIDLGMYEGDTPILTTSSTKNNVEILQYTTTTQKTFNLRAFLRNYISSSSTTYLKISVAYRIYD